MRALAFEALQHYDFEVARLRLVNNETNCTFRVDTTGGETYALRISLPDIHGYDEIEAEIDWLRGISHDTDIRVPAPVATRNGSFVVTAGAPGVPEERNCVLFSWVRGRELADVPTLEAFQDFGTLAARIHRHSAAFQPAHPASIRSLNTLYPLGDDREMIFEQSTAELFPETAYRRLLEMHAAAKRELEWLFNRGEVPQLLHGDFHWWNVMSYRGELRAIDFEDLAWGYPVQDVAISFYYFVGEPEYQERRQAFQFGYESVSPWPERYPGQIELHMVHRAIDLFNFVLGSTLRHDEKLVDHFVKRFQSDHARRFDIWRSEFKEEFYR